MSASKYECHRMPCLRLCKWVCLPFVIPKREGHCGKSVFNCLSSEGKSVPKVQRAIKSQRISLTAHYCISIHSRSLMHKRWKEYSGMMSVGGFPDHNFPWVMNCEMQQKPPLLQEGFRARTAIDEWEGVKMPSSNKIQGRKKNPCVIEIRLKAHTVHIMHGSSNPVSEESL